jgi:hypothetical protein
MTASNFVINSGDTVAVVVGTPTPWVQVNVTPPPTAAVVTVAGPQGPAGTQGASGAPGPAYSSPAWFFDNGPPGTIIGAKPGDLYMDLLTGTIYELGG